VAGLWKGGMGGFGLIDVFGSRKTDFFNVSNVYRLDDHQFCYESRSLPNYNGWAACREVPLALL
jgi:hypothetical protein